MELYRSVNRATRSVTLIIIYEDSDHFCLAAHTGPFGVSQGARQKVKVCTEARSEICLCSA